MSKELQQVEVTSKASSEEDILLDELADILFDKWLQETGQTGYTIDNES